jgi:hypothetical protein
MMDAEANAAARKMVNVLKGDLRLEMRKRIVKILLSLLLCFVSIWSMSRLAGFYGLAGYCVVLVVLPFSAIYLYQCYSLFSLRCPSCKKFIFGPIFSGKGEALFKSIHIRRCSNCGEEF